jgi:lipopolysaccharide transport system ATP-binding protein
MKNTVISLNDVSKAYPGRQEPSERFWSLFGRELVVRDPFWALRGVTLQVEKGMSIGVVGRNGAGKSTLMQIIAGTVEPTSGSVRVEGRVSPLLELGAGFNPDFTGWENAELSGAILGISPRELRQKLDSIAAFADIGSFIHKPVKTYSSGMYARLAFSVAVHVEPDILLVDEILSVGDMGFQHRCLARLREMRERGLTLLFVSHSPDAIKSVCSHAVFFQEGHVAHFGTADDTVHRYLAYVQEETNREQLLLEEDWGKANGGRSPIDASLRHGSGHVQVKAVEIYRASGQAARAFALGEKITIEIEIESRIDVADLSLSFVVRDGTGTDIFGTTTFDERVRLRRMRAGETQKVQFEFGNSLRAGNYGIGIAVNRVTRRDYTDNIVFDQVDGVASFMVFEDENRPVHYKVYQETKIRVLDPFPVQRVEVA